MKNGWTRQGSDLIQRDQSDFQESIPRGVYTVNLHPIAGFYLTNIEDEFAFSYKLYQTEGWFVDRSKKTYDATTGNFGTLFNGPVGSGKTVTAKLLCNRLQLPVLIINHKFDAQAALMNFLNSIRQDVVIFIDEYEKIYTDYDDALLSLMDGVMSTANRRVFLLTTNKMYISSHMLQRPSRIRYVMTFGDLTAASVAEIVDDLLVNTTHKQKTMEFIAHLSLITVDLVKSIVQEVNIHDEPPQAFGAYFNVKSDDPKYYDVYRIFEDGVETLQEKEQIFNDLEDLSEGDWFNLGRKHVGTITRLLGEQNYEVLLNNGAAGIFMDEEIAAGTSAIFRLKEAEIRHRAFKNFPMF